MSNFEVRIGARIDLSKAQTELNAFLNKKHELNFSINSSGISNMSGEVEKQLSQIGKTIKSSKFTLNPIDFATTKQKLLQETKSVEKIMQDGVKGLTKKDSSQISKQYTAEFQKIQKIREKELSSKNYSNVYQEAFNAKYSSSNELKEMKSYYEEQEKLAEKIQKIREKSSSGIYEYNNAKNDAFLKKYEGMDSPSLERAKKQIQEITNLQKELSSGKYLSSDGSLSSKTLIPEDEISKASKLDTELKNLSITMKTVSLEAGKPISSLEAFAASNKTLTWLKNNTKAAKEYGEALRNIAERQKAATTVEELSTLNREFKNITSQAQLMGKTGNSFGAELKRGFEQIGQFVGVYGVLQKGVDTVKQMAREVINVDTAMTNLYKVTDETTSKYNEFLSSSGDTAKSLGRNMSSYIEQTATWAKLGYNLDQSKELAKTSSIYANVGEVNDQTAVSDLVTSLKAFNIEAKDSIDIVDKLNILGNEFATSSADLGEGLSNSASALALGGMDLNKALALLTGGAEITQSAGELGNALKIGQMRVMGMKGKLEELGEESEGIESVSKIQTHILNLTKGQVNIMDKADPSKFRDYYDILKDIAEVYDSLVQTEQADLLETLFGKQRGNQGAALIQAFQSGQIQKAYQTSLNAGGSAQKEQDKWMESAEAKIQQLQAQFQQFSTTTIDSDFFQGLIDGATGFLNIVTQIIDKVGILPTILGGVGATALKKNWD